MGAILFLRDTAVLIVIFDGVTVSTVRPVHIFLSSFVEDCTKSYPANRGPSYRSFYVSLLIYEERRASARTVTESLHC